jgi:hydroxymethylglutaryl-CoA lyase
MDLPSKVKLREVAPRDGFQSLKDFLPTEQKLQIIEAVVQAGVKDIESTSFVSPKAIPQLRDAAGLFAQGGPKCHCCQSRSVGGCYLGYRSP